MSYEILLPQLGFSMTEGRIAEWFKADGERVSEGELLYAIEAEKAVEDVAAPATGTLRILAAAGETYAVGYKIGVIE